MNWLVRLKKFENAQTGTLQNLQNEAFVGFVGAAPEPFQKSAPGNDTFTARLVLFTARGLSLAEAEAMAARLERRDREGDERRLCLECRYLSGGPDARRCSQWRTLGLASAAIPADLATIPQRCPRYHDEFSRNQDGDR